MTGRKPTIVVLDGHTLNPGDNPWDGVARLGELTIYDRTAKELILERAQPADVVLTNKTPVDADVLARLPRLRFISILATGYNVVDVAAAELLRIVDELLHARNSFRCCTCRARRR